MRVKKLSVKILHKFGFSRFFRPHISDSDVIFNVLKIRNEDRIREMEFSIKQLEIMSHLKSNLERKLRKMIVHFSQFISV